MPVLKMYGILLACIEECMKHHGHKESTRMILKICGTIGENIKDTIEPSMDEDFEH